MKIMVSVFLLSTLLCKPAIAQSCVAPYTEDIRQSLLNWTGYYLFNFGEHSGTVDIVDGQIATREGQLTGFVLVDILPARVTFQDAEMSVITKFKFDRTKWGVHYNSGKIFSEVGDGAISDAIAVDVNLKATR